MLSLVIILWVSWGFVICACLVEVACSLTGYDARDFAAVPGGQGRSETAMDPSGSDIALKNKVAWLMAMIAKRKEKKKFASESAEELERFHDPIDHDFFNESYYFNGADEKNQRFITRISHRGRMGAVSYVFLLLDVDGVGALSLEEDNVLSEIGNDGEPTSCGLSYVCEIPMQRWRITYDGPMTVGCVHPSERARQKKRTVHAKLDLVYERATPTFWYMRDDSPSTLAKNLSQEPWGYNFFKVCVTRSSHHAHYEEYGRCTGTVQVGGKSRWFDFGTFRDHSWDIRRWPVWIRHSSLRARHAPGGRRRRLRSRPHACEYARQCWRGAKIHNGIYAWIVA